MIKQGAVPKLHNEVRKNNTNIEKVEQFQFLGITLDSNLNWKKHSDNITNNCSRIIGILYIFFHKALQSCFIMHFYYHTLITAW